MSAATRGNVPIAPAPQPSRSWCFTVNNYTFVPTALPQYGRYAIVAREKGEQGTDHLQGYIELTRPVRYTHIQTWLQARCHCEKRLGTRDQAREYCLKEDTEPVELGNWVRTPGKRTDIQQLYQDAKNKHLSLREVADKHGSTYMRYHRAAGHVRKIFSVDKPEMRTELKVSLFLGPPGTGKTHAAYEEDKDLYALPLGKDMWFDNYQGEKTLLLDDFSGELRLVDLLRILDMYPVQIPVKGDFVWLQATRIIITSNEPIEYWYKYQERTDSLAALKRRIHEVRRFDTPFVFDPYTAPTQKQTSEEEDSTECSDEEEDQELSPFERALTSQLLLHNDPCPGEKGKEKESSEDEFNVPEAKRLRIELDTLTPLEKELLRQLEADDEGMPDSEPDEDEY